MLHIRGLVDFTFRHFYSRTLTNFALLLSRFRVFVEAMLSTQRQHSFDILYSRYSDCLHEVDIAALSSFLVKQELLTLEDRRTVTSHTKPAKQKQVLCKVLAARGSNKLCEHTEAIKQFKRSEEASQRSGKRGAAMMTSHPPLGNGTVPVDKSAVSQTRAPEGHMSRKKHQMTDVPDPPLDVGGIMVTAYQQMEAFVVLLYTFICQDVHEVKKIVSDNFQWLQVDVSLDKIKEYFPRHLIQGVRPNPTNPVKLRLSTILDAFSQFHHKFEQLSRENKSLSSRAKLVQDLTHRNATLQEELSMCKRRDPRQTHSQRDLEKFCSQIEALEGELVELRRALARSEDRNKQLVGVTQQWAVECSGKDRVISVLETQLKDLGTENEHLKRQKSSLESQNRELMSVKEQLKKKLSKTKKQLSESQLHLPEGQFEELRVELAQRRELYDKAITERDDAQENLKIVAEQNSLLNFQLEEQKDLLEEMRDKLGNLKVQTSAREPSVREMSLLAQENRELKDENEQTKKQMDELKDELLAYKTHVKYLQEAARDELRDAPRVPVPLPRQPAKTQTLVTGYSVPRQKHPKTRTNEVDTHQNGVKHPPTDTEALTRPKSPPAQPQLKPVPMHVATVANGPTADNQESLSNGEHDYTQHIRYPNHSGILVQPLRDDDLSVLQSILDTGESQNPKYVDQTPLLPSVATPAKVPSSVSPSCSGEKAPDDEYPSPPNQPVAILAEGTRLSFSSNERRCPVCKNVFYTLGENEFQSHLAGCFK